MAPLAVRLKLLLAPGFCTNKLARPLLPPLLTAFLCPTSPLRLVGLTPFFFATWDLAALRWARSLTRVFFWVCSHFSSFL